jgi:hypothetical protein
MAKYYIRVTEKLPLAEGAVNPLSLIKDYQEIVDAKNGLEACLKVWLRLRIDAKGAVWIVNETGFADSDDDIYFNDDPVMKRIDKLRKKRRDP